ncbi:MAG: hypothetical protein COT36_02100 [Parcubacteria group bacterium CG08_land_8_20_14_0_20_38_56]|nr:MAG: hypothetical protein COT36_02100 [Parcubacteria group bacterium CG08_land_8_20_14_0_20_38_56]
MISLLSWTINKRKRAQLTVPLPSSGLYLTAPPNLVIQLIIIIACSKSKELCQELLKIWAGANPLK